MEPLMSLIYGISFFAVLIAFAFAYYLHLWVKGQKTENEKIIEVSQLIQAGANTFMRREYGILAKFAGVAAVVIFVLLPSPIWEGDVLTHISMVIAYLAGTTLSALAGKIGILVATSANSRAAEGAGRGLKPAFLIGFRGGSVMGLAVVGFCLLGVMLVLMLTADATILLGFSFGASSLALFAKAGGGIFTKTADVSADLTGKVELGIPEDDPRNPAVIADNVGDNVGDVAGMGADLFDSNVAAMASALVMAQALDGGTGVNSAMVFCTRPGTDFLHHRNRLRQSGQGRKSHQSAELIHLHHHRPVYDSYGCRHLSVRGLPVEDLGRIRSGIDCRCDHRHYHRLFYR